MHRSGKYPGRPTQTASSATGVAQLSAAGDWSQITLRGNVRLQEGGGNAEGQQGCCAASQTTVLTGQAMVRDTGSETHAPKITFFRRLAILKLRAGALDGTRFRSLLRCR